MERAFGCDHPSLDVNDEVKKVEEMYWQTRAEIDANTLDGYARPRDNTKNVLQGRGSILAKLND